MVGHVPVLQREVLETLALQPGDTVVDCTLGLGGHASLFLNAIGSDGRLIAFDADTANMAKAKIRLAADSSRTEFHLRNFRDVGEVTTTPVDAVFADLGLSSPHLDDPERGFTFRASGPLDLRYDRASGESAADFLQSAPVERIAEVLKEFGEIQRSKMLARVIRTSAQPVRKTDDLVRVVTEVFGYRAPKVLPQIFQALRIAVNDELGSLRALLDALPRLVKPGGRVAIISYHSLEDRMVKQTFRAMCTPEIDDRTGQIAVAAPWEAITRKAIVPTDDEISVNPRSRSARLRSIIRSSH